MRSRVLGLMLLALAAAACARTAIPAGAAFTTSPARAVTLVVENHNFADVDVFIVRGGEILTRLGMVDGESVR